MQAVTIKWWRRWLAMQRAAGLRSTPGPVYCSHCGAPNQAGATYCAACGKMLNP